MLGDGNVKGKEDRRGAIGHECLQELVWAPHAENGGLCQLDSRRTPDAARHVEVELDPQAMFLQRRQNPTPSLVVGLIQNQGVAAFEVHRRSRYEPMQSTRQAGI
jgi:hypothetical protein